MVYPAIVVFDDSWPLPYSRPRPPLDACDWMEMADAASAKVAAAAAVNVTSAARREDSSEADARQTTTDLLAFFVAVLT